MKIIRLNYNNNNFPCQQSLDFVNSNLCLAIGNFDGIHLGHQQIINRLKKISFEKNLASAVMSFEPHPAGFFDKNKNQNYYLTTLKQKIKTLKNYQIDFLILVNFNKFFCEISASNFISEILQKQLNVKNIIVGYDFTFGKDRQGNFIDLKQANFNVEKINPYKIIDNDIEIICSSSKARIFVSQGEIDKANKILGHNFSVEGKVISGQKLASKLGFPTANLMSNCKQIKPKFGVYQSLVTINNNSVKLPAITNFGVKPTINNNISLPLFENHILNFSENIYHQKITVELINYIRHEQAFDNILNLQQQIKKDIEIVKKLHKL